MEADNSQPIKDDDKKAGSGSVPNPPSYFGNLKFLLQNCRLKIKPESTTEKANPNNDNGENSESQGIEPPKSPSPPPTELSEKAEAKATMETEKTKSDSESNASFKSCDEPVEESRPSEDEVGEDFEVPKCRTFVVTDIFEELTEKMKNEEETWLNEVIGSPSDFQDCKSDNTSHASEDEDEEQVATEEREDVNSFEDDAEESHTEEKPLKSEEEEQQETTVDETNNSFNNDDDDAPAQPENPDAEENLSELNTSEAEVTSPQDISIDEEPMEVQSELINETKTSNEKINCSPEESPNISHGDDIIPPEHIRTDEDPLLSSDQESEVEAHVDLATSADINQNCKKKQDSTKPRMKRCCVSLTRCDRLIKRPKLDVQTSPKPLSPNKINLEAETNEADDYDDEDELFIKYSVPLSRAASRMASVDSDVKVKIQDKKQKTTADKKTTKKTKKTKAKSKGSKVKLEKTKKSKDNVSSSSSSSGSKEKKMKPKIRSCKVSVFHCDKPSKLRVSMKTLGVKVRCPFCERLSKTWKKFNVHQRKKHKKSQRKS